MLPSVIRSHSPRSWKQRITTTHKFSRPARWLTLVFGNVWLETLVKSVWQIKLKQNIEERVENRNKRQRENGLYSKFCTVRSKDTSMSDSIFFFLKRVFSVLSYSSLYFPSITPQFSHSFLLFPTTPKPGCSSFRLALPRAIFLLIWLGETPTDKKKKGRGLKIFFLAFIQF